MIVIVFGLPGSGKSFFASRLASFINGDYVNSDQIRLKMFKERTYTEEEKEMVYHTMLDMAKDAHLKKTNLVIDATFYKQALRQLYQEAIDKDLYFIEVIARKNVIKKRLSLPRTFSEADFKVYKKIKKEWEPMEEKHLVLESTNENIGEMLDRAALHLPFKP